MSDDTGNPRTLLAGGREQFLYREARYLDDRDWDAWLSLYAHDAEFWMPAWDDDDTLTEDPQTRNFADLVWQQGRPGGPGVPYPHRTLQRDEPAGAANLAQHQQRRDPGAER